MNVSFLPLLGTSASRQFDCLDCTGGSWCGANTITPNPCGVGLYSAVGQYACVTCEIG